MQSVETTTKLPSIQSMLEGISLSEPTPVEHKHKRHTSEQITAFTFADEKKHGSLSIQPRPVEPDISRNGSHSPPLLSIPPSSDLLFPRHHHHSPRNLHSRSYSDYTHPYPTPRQLAPLATTHRRAVSTNTFDLILRPLMQRPSDTTPPSLCTSSSTSSTTTTTEEGGYTSDESVTPTKAEENGVNKYACPYCNKGFSRPSSLRIHTYSHTGERPFECPEQDCNRKFSVQSNMRRHLRVHRLGRPLKRNGGLISPADRAQLINKPLAAKPTNWIGVTRV